MDKMYKFACRLSNINRFQGIKLMAPYNVAEHSYRVAILAMRIADDFKGRVNTEKVLKSCLLHDLEEAGLGDVPQPFKHYFNDYEEAEESFLINEVELPKKYLNLKAVHNNGSNEGRIVKLADLIEAFITSAFEIERGNTPLFRCYNEIDRILKGEEKFISRSKYASELISKVRREISSGEYDYNEKPAYKVEGEVK